MERRNRPFFKDLQQKLLHKFEGKLNEDNYKLFWIGDEGTRIRINDNEDLEIAVKHRNKPFYSLIAVMHNSHRDQGTRQKIDTGMK